MKKISWGSVLLTAGVLMFLVGLSVTYDKSKAVAYANQYKERYEVSKWRVLRNPIDDTGPAGDGINKCMKLGPAEWKVTGSFGDSDAGCTSGETCFEETWSVPSTAWHEDYDALRASENVFYTVDNEGKEGNNTKCVFSSSPGDVAVWNEVDGLFFNGSFYTYQAGLYGGYGAFKNRSGLSTFESVGFHSWPKEWLITGSVGAP